MNYAFDNTSRLGSDPMDESQQNLANTQYANHIFANYYKNQRSDSHVVFATQQPAVQFTGLAGGNGLPGNKVDFDSLLLIKTQQERPFEKLQLFQRPFLTVPYLGRGSVDPSIESMLQQGENVSGLKSVSTIMEQSFLNYSLMPNDDKMESRTKDASSVVQESVLDGWVRGGANTREYSSA